MRSTSLAVGAVLWLGATALLLDDAIRTGHVTVQHALMPCMTAGTVWAAVMLHHSLSNLRIGAAVAFLALALVGSASTVYSTLGRTAEARDQHASAARSSNSALDARRQALAAARSSLERSEAEVARECRSGFGRSCAGWRATADERRAEVRRVEAELSSMREAPVDARLDAAVKIGTLLGADAAWLRALIDALDPVLLPFFLEFGSIVAFAAGVPAHRDGARCGESDSEAGEDDGDEGEVVSRSRDEALADLRGLLASGAVVDGRMLSRRWNVSETTVSRWQSSWARGGLISRARDGRSRRPISA